jgi:hypothetical protein
MAKIRQQVGYCPRTKPREADLWAALVGQIRLAGIVVWPLIIVPAFNVVRYCGWLLGHREYERSKKGYGENRGKSVGHCHGRVPKWLPNPNQRNRKRYDCQRKTNNHNCPENDDYILARYQFGRHALALLRSVMNLRAHFTSRDYIRACVGASPID